MRIQNNIMALNTHRLYTINNENTAKASEKLSSGYRINRAGDDAAGLAISEKMRAQIRGLNMAAKNSNDAISMVQTAEGALQEVHAMLQRMNELAVQSATGTNQDLDRDSLDAEYQQLILEIDDIANQTTFNNMKLLDTTKTFEIQVGALEGETLDIKMTAMGSVSLGLATAGPPSATSDIKNVANASAAITKSRDAINTVSELRAQLGAVQNRLEHKIANLDTSAENLQAAESRIRDVDMAKEMTNYTKNQILSQASTAMLAQANNAPQSVLQLLK